MNVWTYKEDDCYSNLFNVMENIYSVYNVYESAPGSNKDHSLTLFVELIWYGMAPSLYLLAKTDTITD